MKKQLLILTFLFSLGLSYTAKAQLLLPDFNEPQKLDAVNSDAEESYPFPFLDGKKLYFVKTTIIGSMKERLKSQDIWSSEFDGTNWSSPSNLFEHANDNGNNAVIGASRDGNTVYVFNSVQTRRKLAKGIAVTKKDENGEWSDLKKVNIPGFKVGEGFYSFYMTPEENILLIGMAASDTSSQNDLFVSHKGADGNWGELKSLGSTINSDGNELSPYIDATGTNLYFASTGHKGLGDADIFMAKRLDDSWTNWSVPLNLGAPINSEAFDAYFIIGNNNKVFFTSNRGQTYSDIYSCEIKEKVVLANKEVLLAQFNFKSIPTENVTLLIFDENDNLIETAITDENGRFSFTKLSDSENYKIKVDSLSEGYSEEYADAKIYLIDDEGVKLKRLTPDKNGVFGGDDLEDNELINGIFEYNKLAQANTALVIFDENGFPVDTIYTDENGKFSYEKLSADQNYSIKPLNQSDYQVDDLSLYSATDGGDKKVHYSPNETPALADKETEGKKEEVKKDDITVKKDNTTVVNEATETAIKSSGEIVYFNFNETILSNDDRITLDKAIEKLTKDKNLKVTLIGFTDSVGTKANNIKVASARARVARQHLLDNGIERNRITIYGYGEVMFKGDNKTEEGRALNRRVEVSYN